MLSPMLYHNMYNTAKRVQASRADVSPRTSHDKSATENDCQLDKICCCFCPFPRIKPQNALIESVAEGKQRNGGRAQGKLSFIKIALPSNKSDLANKKRLSTITEEDSAAVMDSGSETTEGDINSIDGGRRYGLFQDPLSSFHSDNSVGS